MKKLWPLLIIIILVVFYFWGPDPASDNNTSEPNSEPDASTTTVEEIKDQTYVKYSGSKRDGLRSKAYYMLLFNTTENAVTSEVRLTAGAGKTTVRKGTYEGSFDDKIVITYDNGAVETLVSQDGCLKSEDGKITYSRK